MKAIYLTLFSFILLSTACEKIKKQQQHKNSINTLISRVSSGDASAIDQLISELSVAESDLDNTHLIGELYYDAGYAVNELGLVQKKVSHHEKARELFKKADNHIDDDQGLLNQGTITTALASTYHRIGLLLYPDPRAKAELDTALTLYTEATKILRASQDFQNLSITLYSKASIYATWGDYDRAIPLLEEAVSLDRKHNLPDLAEDEALLKQIKHLQSEQRNR
ncbi:MAG: tetratricopeptide repeat protein [Akkermansiaceae bacterium]